MDSNKVELINCDSGDWEVLIVNGEEYYQDHSIPTSIWLEVLNKFGVSTEKRNVSNEDIEMGNY